MEQLEADVCIGAGFAGLATREHDWGAEDYSRGGYRAHMPPGTLTRRRTA
ncbi:MAG TPA: hypothetical protein VFB51_08015 [Solirubrobacterales bacterium]|nr:hypothetical protein [Solirubrobacterales bacterium]